jgi:hypothetical protein
MTKVSFWPMAGVAMALAVMGSTADSAQDRYTLKVPNGPAFSEFRGYEDWKMVAVSRQESLNLIEVILANPVMIQAYQAGIPFNGKPVPEGAKLTKIHWNGKKSSQPGDPIVPGTLHDIDFMVKDSKRFADSGGWGYAEFDYDAAADTFKPLGNDGKCGAACHTIAKKDDFVFTAYPKR